MALSVLHSGLRAEGRRGQYSGWRDNMNKNERVNLADEVGVSLLELEDKINQGLSGVSISHFTDAELEVLRECLVHATYSS